MDEFLNQETEKLVRSWIHHERGWLRDYLVAGVEDPRINLQSILTRHFIIRALAGDRLSALRHEECRFGAVMNWLLGLTRKECDLEELAVVGYALGRGSDNAEGTQIPAYVLHAFRSLPATADNHIIPNYIENFLKDTKIAENRFHTRESSLDTFARLWQSALDTGPTEGSGTSGGGSAAWPELERPPLRVLEPACGSANDYRFLDRYGIARRIQYTGFDLCAKNIDNARSLFADAQFSTGNVFGITGPDKSFDLCFMHDLFEHLSLKALPVAASEVCRVTRQGLCLGFFNLDEIPEHVERPVDDYHWNTLSLRRIKELFAARGFDTQVVHIASFLRQEFGCDDTHNPNAYTLFLRLA